jgi:hypothetical protein
VGPTEITEITEAVPKWSRLPDKSLRCFTGHASGILKSIVRTGFQTTQA